jgi:hypothetical protein
MFYLFLTILGEICAIVRRTEPLDVICLLSVCYLIVILIYVLVLFGAAFRHGRAPPVHSINHLVRFAAVSKR